MSQPGVDLASFQGPPGEWKGAAGMISWAGVKLTELEPDGNRYVNEDAAADWAYLKENDKARIAYLFGHPSTSAADSVDLFLGQLAELGLEDVDGVALDHETTDGLGPEAVSAWAVEVTDRVGKQLDRTPLLYTYLDFADGGYCDGLGHLPLWMSDPSSPPGKPRVPGPWKTWWIHQYATGGPIDRDVAKYRTPAAMRKAIGKHETAPTRSGDPMQFVSQLRLDGKQTVAANRKPVELVWTDSAKKSLLGPGGRDVTLDAAAVMFSCVSLHLNLANSVRLVLTPVDADGKEQAALAKDYDANGGWFDFVMPFDGQKGWGYTVALINYGTHAVVIDDGSWQLIS